MHFPRFFTGKQLLAIRTKVNTEITRMIMLRETTSTTPKKTGECDCGILGEVEEGLDGVVNMNEKEEGGDEGDKEEGGNPGDPGYSVPADTGGCQPPLFGCCPLRQHSTALKDTPPGAVVALNRSSALIQLAQALWFKQQCKSN